MFCIVLAEKELHCDTFDILFDIFSGPYICAHSTGSRSIIALRDVKQVKGEQPYLEGLNKWMDTIQ